MQQCYQLRLQLCGALFADQHLWVEVAQALQELLRLDSSCYLRGQGLDKLLHVSYEGRTKPLVERVVHHGAQHRHAYRAADGAEGCSS